MKKNEKKSVLQFKKRIFVTALLLMTGPLELHFKDDL
jgi:hypothetical protein